MKPSKIVYLAIFLLFLYLFITRANFVARLVYPFHYSEIITQEAHKNGLEPLFIAAVVRVESGFDKKAKSSKGALGLMQIMPETGLWVAEQIGMEAFAEEKLYDPLVNITIGTWYLQDLFCQFDGNKYAALAAYNGGRTYVSRWLKSGLWDGTKNELGNIPFPETRFFVLKVDKTYKRYQQIYQTK